MRSKRLGLPLLLLLFSPTLFDHNAIANGSTATAEAAFADAVRLRSEQHAQSNREAIARFREAAGLWRAAGKLDDATIALRSAGELLQLLAQTSAAKYAYEDALSLTKQTRNQSEAARVHNGLAYLHFIAGNTTKAQQHASAALKIGKELADRTIEATALSNLGETMFVLDNLVKAQEHQQQSLAIFRELNNQRGQAIALIALGYYYANMAQPADALKSCSDGLALARSAKDLEAETLALIAIASVKRKRGDKEEALTAYKSAKSLAERTGDRTSQAQVHAGIGAVSIDMGDYPAALTHTQEAVKIFTANGQMWGAAENKIGLGIIHHALGENDKALENLNEAVASFRSERMHRLEAITLRTIGLIYGAQGNTQRALASFQRALDLLDVTKDQRWAAYILNYIGQSYEDLNQPSRAGRYYRQALELAQRSADPESETLSYYNLARFERGRGNLDEAKRHIEKAIRIAEDVRTKVSSQDLRSTYFATIRDSYDLYIDVLMLQHKRDPTAGYDREAFAVSERARARSLLELLRESQTNARNTFDSLPQPLTLKETQERILNDETSLLEFALGNERSYAWLVAKNDFFSFTLPGRAEIEKSAKSLYQVFVDHQLVSGESTEARAQRETKAAAALPHEIVSLSKLLLAPLAGKLNTKRLLVVPDGALQYIPFQVLLSPDSHEPLIKHHEIVNEPSASTLALVLSEIRTRQTATNLVAVLADPVFETNDSRVKRDATRKLDQPAEMLAVRRALRDVGITPDGLQIPRLLASGREADEIMALAPGRSNLKAAGFAATRDRIFSADLASYRIVHIATHGIINNEHPEESGIVLSLVDQNGQAQDGFLRLRDIYTLKLPADLVVLSACSTALGKDVRGEGLIGITRGFMYAGAAGVVASLWKVDDEATAELMKHFYAALFNKGMPPAAALRDAQLELAKHPRWQSPYYWAGFVIQGQYDQKEKFSQSPVGKTEIAVLAVLGGSLLLASIVLHNLRRRRTRDNE
ncbi:MAG TPA: CHAT domain-containing protein [Pyrinomonadaceae bacterium]|nr:CHAT domain-containing protein [Pyrinomonadaceae bacterium]